MLPKSWEEVHAIYISSVYVFYKTHREELSTVFISRKGLSTVFCVCFKLPQYCPGLAWSDMPFSSVSKASSRCQDIYLVLLLGIKDLCLSLLQSQRSERPTGFSTWICLCWIFCQTNFKTETSLEPVCWGMGINMGVSSLALLNDLYFPSLLTSRYIRISLGTLQVT